MKYCPQCMKPLADGRCPDGCLPPAEGSAPHILSPGTLLNGRYLVGRTLGQGGFGITYIGRDQVLDIRVAIKEYYPSGFVTRNVTASQAVVATGQDKRDLLSRESEKFLAEARILAKFIGEPGIVEIRDYFRANNTAYIVMEYLDGETLRDCVLRRGRLAPEEAFALLEPVMRSLDKVHQAGLIHRDVSPDNIMLLSGGGVKLLDFGTARSASPYGEQSLSVMLKPGYAPEEQYRSKGSQGPWTDVYGLCATMYKCVTGITPEDSLQRLYEDTVVPPSRLGIAIPPAQENALMMGMACRMQNRFQSIGALAAALGISGFALPPEREAPPEAPPTVLLMDGAPEERTESLFQNGAPQPPPERQAPPPQTPPKTPPKAPPQTPPKTPPEAPPVQQKKGGLPLAAVLGGAAAVLVVVLAALWMFRPSGGTPSDRSKGDRSREDRSSASASSSSEDHLIPVGLGETVTLTGRIIDNTVEYADKWIGYQEQYGFCVIRNVGIRFEDAIKLELGGPSVQLQEAEVFVNQLVYDNMFDGQINGLKIEVTGCFRPIEGSGEIVESYNEQLQETIALYHPNGLYEFDIESYTLLEGSATQPTTPDGSSSDSSSSPDDPPTSTPDPPSTPAPDPGQTSAGPPESTQPPANQGGNAPLTRLGAAELLVGHLGIQVGSDLSGFPYTDCESLSQQQKASISAVVNAGIMTGVSPTSFGPESKMTFAQMALLLYRASGAPEPDSTGISFANVSPDNWAYNAFAWLANMGAIPSDWDGDPNQTATGKDMTDILRTLS